MNSKKVKQVHLIPTLKLLVHWRKALMFW